MELPSYFSDFLQDIRPTANQKADAKTGHETLRKRLLADDDLAPKIVTTFLQGSYRRATLIRPTVDCLADVDVVVVTKISEDLTPQKAMNLFVPFLEKYYKDKWEFQGRSIGIGLSDIELDLVITLAPSEADREALQSRSVTAEDTPEEADDWRLVKSWVPTGERYMAGAAARLELARKEAEWKLSPLRIPDRDAKEWKDTHPLEQMKWTWAKNRACTKHYVNVVKALKWWRCVNHETPEYPKGYPLEHIIGQSCSDEITSVATGVTLTLEDIVAKYEANATSEQPPTLLDHGVPQNVLHRLSGADFAEFYGQVCDAAVIARRALDAATVRESASEWRKLFGDKFPPPPEDDDDQDRGDDGAEKKAGYSPREKPTIVGGGRYA